MTPTLIKHLLISAGAVVFIIGVFLVLPDQTSAQPQPCALGSCPKEIRATDNGTTMTYRVNRSFGVVLDRRIYPIDQVICDDRSVAEKTLALQDIYPNQMHRFQTKNPGRCVIATKDFKVTINTVAEP